MLDRVKLNKNQKRFMQEVSKSSNPIIFSKEDYKDIEGLELEGFLMHVNPFSGKFDRSYITQKGRIYLYENPKLKNPSILQDKKYLINTSLTIIAILLSGLSIYLSWMWHNS